MCPPRKGAIVSRKVGCSRKKIGNWNRRNANRRFRDRRTNTTKLAIINYQIIETSRTNVMRQQNQLE
jgi:hypothetical protein